MSAYNVPTLKLGQLNSVFNPADFQENDEPLTIGEGDTRYLKLTGGTITGNTSCNQSITVPSITLSSNTKTQTNNQIGYRIFINRAITAASVQNGTVSTPNFNTISLPAGVWVVTRYHNITCTASITFTQI